MSEYQRHRRHQDEDQESFFCRFTFGQFFAILLLEVFTLFFVFYLGARFGREFLGMEKQQEVAKKDSRLLTTDDPEVDAIAKELIEKAKTPVLKERIAEMLGTEPAKKPVVVQVQPQKAVEPQVAEKPSGAIRVKSAEGARYSIQVGSYQQLVEANQAVEKWKEKGYPAFMMIADIPNRGRWYRVRLGGFGSRADAEDYMRKVQDREGIEALVVLNEQ